MRSCSWERLDLLSAASGLLACALRACPASPGTLPALRSRCRSLAASPDCANALTGVGGPSCAHGSLHTNGAYEATSCSYCDCPTEWGGVDCSLCRNSSVCPPLQFANGSFAEATCVRSLIPYEEELVSGKVMSCKCTSEDVCQVCARGGERGSRG